MNNVLVDVLEKMQDYNASPTDEILLSLIEDFYLPYARAYAENYERNFSLLPEALHADFPMFSSLPIYLFKVTEAKSFIFDIKNNKFIIHEKESCFFRLLRLLLVRNDLANKDILHLSNTLLEEKEFAHLKALLRAKITKKSFDHEYLEGVKKLATLNPSTIDLHYLNALYLFDKGQKEEAYLYALRAYEKRNLNTSILDDMIKFALMNRRYEEASYYVGQKMCSKGELDAHTLDFLLIHSEEEDVILDAIAHGNSPTAKAPFRYFILLKKGLDDAKKRVNISLDFLPYIGKKLIPYYEKSYIAGVYNQNGLRDADGLLIDRMAKIGDFLIPDYKNFIFDFIYAERKKSLQVKSQSSPLIFPIAGTQKEQKVIFEEGSSRRSHTLAKYEYEFFRLSDDVKISSSDDLIVGEPIKTGHSPTRKKLVLNLMLDALSYSALKRRHMDAIPNILKFFQKGVIFNNHCSVAEYTYPSLATMETGMHMQNSQIVTNAFSSRLPKKYLTLSEQMKKLGYFTNLLSSDSQGILNEVFRGYERIIVNHYTALSGTLIDRTLLHLKAFRDCDLFSFVHFWDTHCNDSSIAPELAAQTHLRLADRIIEEADAVSVHARPTIFNQEMMLHRIRHNDYLLGLLFDYIEKNFSEDEYIVTLYSDHGCSIFTPREEQYLLSEDQVGAALMVRGASVPQCGIVDDELTSAIDIYKILGKLVGFPIDMDYLDGNLPSVFGGKKREYTISNSIFPGQTSKFCVRTLDYECRLETKAFTKEDLTCDLSDYQLEIFTRDVKHRPLYSDKLRRYFLEIIENYVRDFRNDRAIIPSP